MVVAGVDVRVVADGVHRPNGYMTLPILDYATICPWYKNMFMGSHFSLSSPYVDKWKCRAEAVRFTVPQHPYHNMHFDINREFGSSRPRCIGSKVASAGKVTCVKRRQWFSRSNRCPLRHNITFSVKETCARISEYAVKMRSYAWFPSAQHASLHSQGPSYPE